MLKKIVVSVVMLALAPVAANADEPQSAGQQATATTTPAPTQNGSNGAEKPPKEAAMQSSDQGGRPPQPTQAPPGAQPIKPQ